MDADETVTPAPAPAPAPAVLTGPPTVADVVPGRAPRAVLRADVLPAVVLSLVVAVLVGLAWWQLEPLLRRVSDAAEAAVAGDAAFVLPALVAGLLTASWAVVRPGPRPLVRFAGTVLSGAVGSLVAWAVGQGLGTDPLRAVGVLLVWPTVVCLGVLVASIVSMITAPE